MTIQNTLLTAALCAPWFLQAQPGSPLIFSVKDGSAASLDVKNTAASTVTAFVLTYPTQIHSSSGRSQTGITIKFADSLLEGSATPIPPNEQRTFPMGRPVSPGDIQLKAVLFADGSAWGDAVWAQRMLARRKAMEQSLVTALADLRDALSRGTSREDLISQFQAASALEKQNEAQTDIYSRAPSPRSLVLRTMTTANRPDGTPQPVESLERVYIRYFDSMLQPLQAASYVK